MNSSYEGSSVRIKHREMAKVILITLARHKSGGHRFCCYAYYDDDIDFIGEVAEKLGASDMPCKSFVSRMQKVCRRLVQCGVLTSTLKSCHAEYFGEPRVLNSYEFSNPSYCMRLAPDLWPHYKPGCSPDWELDFLLRNAYPKKGD